MDYEIVIGLEIHTELKTNSKNFLWMQHKIWLRTKHQCLSGMLRASWSIASH